VRSILAVLPSITIGLSPAPAPVAPIRPSFSAPVPTLTPSALAPALAAAAAPAPVLPILQAAALAPLELGKSAPAEGTRDAAAVPFGEAFARAPLSVNAGEERRQGYRLAPLGFEDLAGAEPSGPDGPPSPRAPEPKPFLMRHYRAFRFFAAPLVRLVYAVRVVDLPRLPAGPALIVPNHVSFMDPVLISFAANRPMRFLMSRKIYETRGLQWLFRSLGAIPISPKDTKEIIEESLYRARRALAAGETVVVFPEGQITRDGTFSPFRRGFERVAAGTGAPVIPAYIDGMWGSAFSRHPDASFLRGLRRRLRGRAPVSVRFGPPLDRADSALARDAVALLARAKGDK
jgi:1-acyl-sn-glycerol-3-phosphate acyltransferase